MKCPNKNTELYKKLISQLSEINATRIYLTIDSKEFDEWYGNGKRDPEGNPYISKYLGVTNGKGEKYKFFNRVEFESINDLYKFLSSERTKGISKLGNYYYVSKNNRKAGLKALSAIQTKFPGLVKFTEYQSNTDELGVVDQSMPVIRLVINEDYFSNDIHNFVMESKTEIPKISSRQYIINRLHEYLQRINNKLQDAKRDKLTDKVVKYDELYKKTQQSIKDLQAEETVDSILGQAKKDLKYIQSVLKNKTATTEELIEVGNLIDLYINIDQVNHKTALIDLEDLSPRTLIKVDSEGKEIEEEDITDTTKNVQSVASQFRLAKQSYDNTLKILTTKELNKTFQEDFTEEEVFKPTEDISWFKKSLLGTNRVGNKLLSLLNMIRSTAIEKSNQETLENQKKREEMLNKLKGSSLFNRLGRAKFMELMWQKDKNGKPTGGIINQLSDSYYKYRSNYFKVLKSKDKNKIKKAKEEYFKNHEFVNYFETAEEKQAEIDRLSSIYGEEFVINLIEKQDKAFQEFRERRELAYDNIDGLFEDDLGRKDKVSLDKYKELRKEIWDLENNPIHTINNLKNGTSSVNPMGELVHNSFEFVKVIPKRFDENGNKTEWYDDAYDQIENDPIAFEYYNYVKDTLKDLLKQYPETYLQGKDIHTGFIPNIKKSLFQEMRSNGFKLNGLKDASVNLVSTKTYSKTSNHIKPGTDTVMNTLNIQMLSPEFKYVENGKIVDTGDILTDLDEILNSFIPVTNLYKHKSRIEGTYNLVANSISQLTSVSSTSTGALKTNGKSETFADENNLTRLREMVQHEIDTFYNRNVSKNEKADNRKILSKEDKLKKEELEEELKEINSKLSNKEELTEEDEQSLIKQKVSVEGKLSDLGRSFSSTKTGKSFLKWYQLLAQGWNIHSPVIELFYGFMSNYNHAVGGADFTVKQIGRAYSIAVASMTTGGQTQEGKKFNNIVQKFNLVGEIFENDNGGILNSKTNKFNVKNWLKPYEFAKNSDKVSRGSSAIAIMMNTKIKDINGNEVDSKGKFFNLYDALDVDGNLLPEFQSEENLNNWANNFSSTEINELYRLRAKINQVNTKNMGNYDPNSPIMANNTVAGMAITQFRRWMFEGVANRFEKEQYDPILKRIIKGRYITYKDVFRQENGFKTLMSSMFAIALGKFTGGVSNEQLKEIGLQTDVDIENMKKNVQGLIFLIMTWMALVLMRSLSGDDEEKDFTVYKYLINMGGRLQQDLWFYSNPNTANELLGNIVPSSRLIGKIDSWREACYKTIFDVDPEFNSVYERGELKGQPKWLIKTGELVPISSSAIKAYRLGSKILD
ncbi:MAG: hypothetical protein E6R13_03560 [Spirochaetes bacterium]|nr:MAG: hypothetical protein E6R13_03560 [Spirochaetota bacterium]